MCLLQVKGVKLTEADSELYKNFNITISERWQNEIAETVFDVVNQDADKAEQKKRAKLKTRITVDEKGAQAIGWAILVVIQARRTCTSTDTSKSWAVPSHPLGKLNMASCTRAGWNSTPSR